MRILTIVRQVLDAEEGVRVRNGVVDLENSKLVMDAMDEYGVEQGLRLRENGVAEEVVALGAGPERIQDALRTALAMGADRAIHIVANEALDPIALSKVVAAGRARRKSRPHPYRRPAGGLGQRRPGRGDCRAARLAASDLDQRVGNCRWRCDRQARHR